MITFILILSNMFIFVLVTMLSIIIVPVNMARKVYRKDDVKEYLYSIILALDQSFGTLLYGTEDFTTSSWTHYLSSKGNKTAKAFEWFINKLAYFVAFLLFKAGAIDAKTLEKQTKHCYYSYITEIAEFKEKVQNATY